VPSVVKGNVDFLERSCDNRTMDHRYAQFHGNPDFVLSLARGLAVIEAFQDQPDGATVADIARRTGWSRAAVRRLLITLQLLGYATHTGSVYRLGTRILRLGFAFLSSQPLATLAAPVLEDLSAKIHESCSVSVLEGDEIVYLARSATKRVMSVNLSIGSRLPAWCTSMGRVLLAALPDEAVASLLAGVALQALTPRTLIDKGELLAEIARVRQQGYALVDEELEVGLRALAVPIVTRSGRTVAAMNTGVHAARISRQELLERLLPELRKAAALLGQALA
jgi:IclR family pca regulon transcriptional regulator